MSTPHQPLYDEDTERRLLSLCFNFQECIGTSIEKGVSKKSFFKREHGTIFEAIASAHHAKTETDLASVAQTILTSGALEAVGGWKTLTDCSQDEASSVKLLNYVERVLEFERKRGVLSAASLITEQILSGAEPSQDIIAKARLDLDKVSSAPWPVPVPLTRSIVPVMDLERCIPPKLAPFREFCESVAEALQVPRDAIPPLALALASIGTARSLEVELNSIWKETGPLWVAVLGVPGERKSSILSLLTAPLTEWQKQECAHLKYALAAYGERRRIIEGRITGLRQKISRATGHDSGQLESDALALVATLENMPALAAPALITGNATPESIRDLLTRNGEKVALVAAETDAGQLMGTRYSKTGSANIDLYLSSFTGEAVPCHRVGRDMPLARPALSMALCVQPQALANVLNDPVASGRGFIDRLCLIAPKSRMGTRATHPPTINPDLINWWHNTLTSLLDLKWPGRVILTQDGPARYEEGPRVLRLTPDANLSLDTLREHLESRVGEEGDLRPVCGFVSKLPGVIVRIALALEAMQDPAAEYITDETMRAACEWAPFLLAHYRSVRGEAAEKPEAKLAIRLLAAIKKKKLTELNGREAQRLLDTSTPLTAPEISAALDVLVARDWLRDLTPPTEYSPKGGRPKLTRYAVNPVAIQ